MRSKVATLAFAMAAAFASFAGADEGSAVAVERPLRDVLGNTFEFPRCSNVTVSGISSGGFFAVQFHVAFSALVQGAGVIAGGPYFASQGNVQTALAVMNSSDLISLPLLWSETDAAAAIGSIDHPSNLRGSRVYVFAGTLDTVVDPGVSKKLKAYYEHYGALVTAEFGLPAEHSFPTDDYGNKCSYLGANYINNCNMNGAMTILRTVYGAAAKNNSTRTAATRTRSDSGRRGKRASASASAASAAAASASAAASSSSPPVFDGEGLVELDQRSYIPAAACPFLPLQLGLQDKAYAYVPPACRNATAGGKCLLHVVFHGCHQTLDDLGLTFVNHTQYVQVARRLGAGGAGAGAGGHAGVQAGAEGDDHTQGEGEGEGEDEGEGGLPAPVVVLFPQFRANALNPRGCADWWGFSGADFATKAGCQMATVRRMVDSFLA